MSSTYGENLKLSIFGQSHGEAIGAVLLLSREQGARMGDTGGGADDDGGIVFLGKLIAEQRCGVCNCREGRIGVEQDLFLVADGAFGFICLVIDA